MPPKLVYFDSVAGSGVFYARVNKAYGDLSLCTKSRRRRLNPGFLKKLNGLVQEINWVCYGALGDLQAVTSGGAYVAKAGWHSKGRAFDLGGLHWTHHVLTCLEVARDYHGGRGLIDMDQYLIYLAVESVIRKWFGTCLGIHYNRRHHNHWHFDPGTPVCYRSSGFGSMTRVRYVQEVLNHVWQIDCGEPDGKEGPRTQKSIKVLRDLLAIGPLTDQNAWLQLLTLTSLKAMQLR